MNQSIKISKLDLKITEKIQSLLDFVQFELYSKDINFELDYYVSTEWFVADNSTSLAIPFYLLNEELINLESENMYSEFEERSDIEILKIIRHEVGHAIDNAFKLYNDSSRSLLFGNEKKYPKTYRPSLTHNQYVQNLRNSYAQSHPAEDFAETFAVWLDTFSSWKEVYKVGEVRRKLEYINFLMSEIRHKKPRYKRNQVDAINESKDSIRSYYSNKLRDYKIEEKCEIFGPYKLSFWNYSSSKSSKILEKKYELTHVEIGPFIDFAQSYFKSKTLPPKLINSVSIENLKLFSEVIL